jgi:hypothetical protein
MIYNPKIELDCKKAIEKLKYFIAKGQKFELKAKHPKRSISQNSYLHLILSAFAIETGYTLEEVKQDIFKKIVNPDIFYVGEASGPIQEVVIERWKSSASLNTQEMTLAIDRFRNFASMELGIYLPEPTDLVMLHQIEQEISKHKNQEFI